MTDLEIINYINNKITFYNSSYNSNFSLYRYLKMNCKNNIIACRFADNLKFENLEFIYKIQVLEDLKKFIIGGNSNEKKNNS